MIELKSPTEPAFNVVLCVYVATHYLFYIKQLFTSLFSFHLETKDNDMHEYAHSWSPDNSDRNQLNN